jgi:integrase
MRSNQLLSPEQKIDARTALQLLAGSGLTLTSAAQIALDSRGKAPAAKPLSWDSLTLSFLADCSRRGRRGATLTYYGTYLGVFGASSLSARWQQLDRPTFRRWLDGIPVAPATRAMTFRSIRTAYRWAARQDPPLCANDPTHGIQLDRPREEAIGFFSVADCAAMLAAMPDRARGAIACQLFAGIRVEEIAPRSETKHRLQWSHLNVSEELIRVPPEVSKIGRGRVLEGLPSALWHWLPRDQTGAVWPKKHGALHLVARSAMPAKWIQRGLRHTFATYATALTGDPAKVAMWLGHEGKPAMLFRHYRGLATKAEGEAFFALRPATKK